MGGKGLRIISWGWL